jgi:Rrf2 family protein
MLSKRTQYAFKALIYLAKKEEKTPVLISEIADSQHIPLKFLENILLELRKAGILSSKKGKGGGYLLRRTADTIKVAEIVRLMNGPIALLPCVSLHFYERCENCNEAYCGLQRVMLEARDATLHVLEGRTLRDML